MISRRISWLVILVLGSLVFSGCGETIHGMGKDAMRVGKGIKTVFISGS